MGSNVVARARDMLAVLMMVPPPCASMVPALELTAPGEG